MSPDDFTEKIELLVNDENRIVTYKILSHELGIHVNKAKQCMMEFLSAQKAKGVNLEVYYFLAGFIEKDGMRSIKVLVVSEDNVEKAKKSYTELTSFHIYSIYKGESKDECALYSADFSYIKDRREQNKFSAIRHPGIEIQPPVLNKMPTTKDSRPNFYKKESNAPSNGNANSMDTKTDPKMKLTENKISPEKNATSNESQDSKGNKSSSDAQKPKSGTLMSMWQNKEEKPNAAKKENTKNETKGKEASKSKPKGNILSMFSKQAEKNATKPPPPSPLPKSVSEEDENSKATISEIIEADDTSKSVNTADNKKSSRKRKVTDKHSKKSKNGSDSDNDFKCKPKKHRRICTFDDSDSESEPEEEKDKAQRSFFLPEEPIETVDVTPVSDEEPIPPTPPVVKGKAKVWKTVQKTYEDEDGFFVTKKEKELVSASEDEEEPVKEKTVKADKKSLAVNKKQASLKSFFKQK